MQIGQSSQCPGPKCLWQCLVPQPLFEIFHILFPGQTIEELNINRCLFNFYSVLPFDVVTFVPSWCSDSSSQPASSRNNVSWCPGCMGQYWSQHADAWLVESRRVRNLIGRRGHWIHGGLLRMVIARLLPQSLPAMTALNGGDGP